jgi:hypothetical protein
VLLGATVATSFDDRRIFWEEGGRGRQGQRDDIIEAGGGED